MAVQRRFIDRILWYTKRRRLIQSLRNNSTNLKKNPHPKPKNLNISQSKNLQNKLYQIKKNPTNINFIYLFLQTPSTIYIPISTTILIFFLPYILQYTIYDCKTYILQHSKKFSKIFPTKSSAIYIYIHRHIYFKDRF